MTDAVCLMLNPADSGCESFFKYHPSVATDTADLKLAKQAHQQNLSKYMEIHRNSSPCGIK